jgi:hypothetical protein
VGRRGRGAARRLAPENLQPWAERIGRLAGNGIPPAIAGERLAQGLVKGVAVERLDRALADLDDNLRWLSGLLERTTARAERRDNPARNELALRAGESALRGGLERAQVERMLGPGPLTLEQTVVLSQVAASLLAAGIAPAEVAKALQESAKAGVKVSELRRLEQRFVAALAEGRSPGSAFADFKGSLNDLMRETGANAAQGEDMRQQMRQEMGQTMRDTHGAGSGGGGGGGPPSISPGAAKAAAAKGRH